MRQPECAVESICWHCVHARPLPWREIVCTSPLAPDPTGIGTESPEWPLIVTHCTQYREVTHAGRQLRLEPKHE